MPERPALFDPNVIRSLADELNSPDIALRFLGEYLRMLPERLKSILTALDDRDTAASLDALLSLKITSSMTGALRAEACCRTLHALVREKNVEQARVEAGVLTATVAHLHAAAPTLLGWAKTDLEYKSIQGPAPQGSRRF
ncbi:Hpt domain-containing protein [Pseudarthrobacter sp. NPDC058329]|uniref:Hpt domain-containing protein n=1 Tax=Pseudarthrobacter sp. NPDC058329 TaxID=3346448 RepID=UPI0036DAA65B